MQLPPCSAGPCRGSVQQVRRLQGASEPQLQRGLAYNHCERSNEVLDLLIHKKRYWSRVSGLMVINRENEFNEAENSVRIRRYKQIWSAASVFIREPDVCDGCSFFTGNRRQTNSGKQSCMQMNHQCWHRQVVSPGLNSQGVTVEDRVTMPFYIQFTHL